MGKETEAHLENCLIVKIGSCYAERFEKRMLEYDNVHFEGNKGIQLVTGIKSNATQIEGLCINIAKKIAAERYVNHRLEKFDEDCTATATESLGLSSATWCVYIIPTRYPDKVAFKKVFKSHYVKIK